MESRSRSPFLIGQLPGYTSSTGHLVSMMNYARITTLAEVQGLGTAELDYLLDDDANSIGMLLEHMIWVERGYQANTFGWLIEGEEVERWRLGSELGAEGRRQIRGFGLDHYLDRLAAIRERTLAELARRDENWLFEESEWWGGKPANNYFKWFHVLEDELNHRGQIRIIRKRLPRSSRQ